MADFNYVLLLNYIIVFLFGFMILVVFLRNFIISWLKVKLPFFKSADILVRVKNPVQDYFCVGNYNNGMLYYSPKARPDNSKPSRMISVSQRIYSKAVYRSYGVPCIDVDDVKNCVLVWTGDDVDKDTQSYSVIIGYNAEAMDETVKTALAKPSLEEGVISSKVFQYIMIGGFLLLGVAIFMVYREVKVIDPHVRLVYDLLTNSTLMGGG